MSELESKELHEKYMELLLSIQSKEREIARVLFGQHRSTSGISTAKKIILLASELLQLEVKRGEL